MRNRFSLMLLLVALMCFAGWTAHAQLQRSTPAKQNWEYQEIPLSANESSTPKLNALGAQGWELVVVTSGCSGDSPCQWWAYMKRAK
jgi:hypothetical protein